MNYKRILFIILLLVLAILFSSPKVVKGSSATLSPEALESISLGFESLEYGGFVDYGVVPASPMSSPAYKDLILDYAQKNVRTNISMSDITSIQQLSYDLLDQYRGEIFVDSDGVSFEEWENLRYCEFDNGYFSGSCIFDVSTGDLVYLVESERNSSLCNVKFGGNLMTVQEWDSTYQEVANDVQTNLYNLNSNNNQYSYYLYWGQRSSGSITYLGSCYVANQYQPGVIVPVPTNGYINHWYTNNPDLIISNTVVGSDKKVIESGTYVYNNLTYNYDVWYAYGLQFRWEPENAQDWLDSNVNGSGLFGRVGYYYDSNLLSNNVTSFYPTVGDLISVTDVYGLDDVVSGVGSASDVLVNNPSYTPDLPVSSNNYPIYIEYPISITSDPTISIPVDDTNVADPDISDTIPGIVEIPQGGFDIPIISDLQNRFPFSIPWDLKNLLKGLRAFPSAPRFQGDLYIAPIDYTYHIDIDLSQFNSQAELFRILFLITFIIGLARFSYTHFFGN